MQERMGQESSDAYVLTLRPSKVWDLTNNVACHALFTMVSLVEEEEQAFRFSVPVFLHYTLLYFTMLEYCTKLYYTN